MYINKTTNKNYQLTTNHVNTNYGSSPINIPSSINRSNRLYIHNPLRRNQRRFININLSNSTDLASPLSRNRVRSFNEANDEIQFDDNPYYFSFDEENVPSQVPPKRSDMFLEDNPCYETIEESIPYMLEKVRNHTEFHKKYCKI